MANNYDITNVKLNGLTIGLIKLNGYIVYPIGEIVDIIGDITIENTSPYYTRTVYFTIIDDTLPYNVNGEQIYQYKMQPNETKRFEFENVKVRWDAEDLIPLRIASYDLSKCSDLSYALCHKDYDSVILVDKIKLHPKPTNMSHLFYESYYMTSNELKELLSQIKETVEVTSMEEMFCNCSNLDGEWDLSSWETSKVTNVDKMFHKCANLQELDLSNWNLSKVSSIGSMFEGCDNLQVLKIPNWNISQCERLDILNGRGLFEDLRNLVSLDFSNCDASGCLSAERTFYNCFLLTHLDLSNCNFNNVKSTYYMFWRCLNLHELDLSSWDTSNVIDATRMFSGVRNCDIYIGDGWTLNTTTNAYSGYNLNFIKYVPIDSIDDLQCSVTPNNVTSTRFMISPIANPFDWAGDLEVIYDKRYLTTTDKMNFLLLEGSQGKTLDVTFRSKKDNSISRTITLKVADDLVIDAIDFGYFPALAPITMPSWITEESRNANYHFIHGSWKWDTTIYGLVENRFYKEAYNGKTGLYWNCYKIVAPKTGTLNIKYRAYTFNQVTERYTIHATSDATQPLQTDTTGRIAHTYGSTYRDRDGIATLDVVEGETYYVHIQLNFTANSDFGENQVQEYSVVTRSFEIV